jgi:hypothetical protein
MKRIATLFVALLLSMPLPAHAQLTRVDPRCDYTIWFFSTLDLFRPDAADCAGAFRGNDINQQGAVRSEILAQGWGTSATFLGSTDTDSNQGPLRRVPDAPIGNLRFDNPLTGDYVIALKASNQFSLYLFTGLSNQREIFYTTLGTAQNKLHLPKDLSHASLWSVSGRTVSVPEPASATLLFTGMMGLGFVSRRRKNGQDTV